MLNKIFLKLGKLETCKELTFKNLFLVMNNPVPSLYKKLYPKSISSNLKIPKKMHKRKHVPQNTAQKP